MDTVYFVETVTEANLQTTLDGFSVAAKEVIAILPSNTAGSVIIVSKRFAL